MERLNHCGAAIQSFRKAQARGDFYTHGEDTAVSWLIDCLNGAVKFILPTVKGDSSLIDSIDVTRALELVRLPYPEVAIEYRVEGDLSKGETPCPKRISLCFSPRSIRLFGIDIPPRSDSDGVYVMSIFEVSSDRWFVVPVLAFLATTGPFCMAPPGLLSHQRGGKGISLDLYRLPFEGMWICYLEGRRSPQEILDLVKADLSDEVQIAAAFCVAMSCSNVREEVVVRSEGVNRRREIKGKRPLYEYRILTVDFDSVKGARGGQVAESGRASPRQHLRRGHVRRVGERIVWVNPAVVGSHGRIDKDYVVKGGNNAT